MKIRLRITAMTLIAATGLAAAAEAMASVVPRGDGATTSPLLAYVTRRAADLPSIEEFEREPAATDLVRRIKRALASLGFYQGKLDSKENRALADAIRRYQKQSGLRVDGRVSARLADQVEQSLKVSGLLKRLERTRSKGMDAARVALLSHPATRDLVSGEDVPPADAARNAGPCFDDPTVRCLLAEAYESAKAVPKQDLRDWVMGEILAAQARAGLTGQAMRTTRRIQDPRLIMVALRDIAAAQARAGRSDDAMAAAEIIPDSRTQIEALAAIADIQSLRGDEARARKTADLLIRMIRHLEEPSDRVLFATRTALALARSGARDIADQIIDEAEKTARDRVLGDARTPALRHVAGALATLGHIDGAMRLLDSVYGESDRRSVLIAAAQAAARAGDTESALTMAADIPGVRYRVLVLGDVALAQAEAGDAKAADKTIESALSEAEDIRLPFARSYSLSRLALALSRMAHYRNGSNQSLRERFVRAREAAEGIKDPRLRAQVLYQIAAEQRTAGLLPRDLMTTELKARDAADEIKSRVSRAWMYGDIASSRARAGNVQGGWDAFRDGMEVARTIETPWDRARALTKMAQTLIDIVLPQSAAPPSEEFEEVAP